MVEERVAEDNVSGAGGGLDHAEAGAFRVDKGVVHEALDSIGAA
jgi:hypothetical protein